MMLRRRFLGLLAGAICTVAGAVYGLGGDPVDDEFWKSEVLPAKGELTIEDLEMSFERHFNLVCEQPRRNAILT